MSNSLRKELGIDEYLELVKKDPNCNGAYISFGQYIYFLEKENKEIEEELKATRKGLNKVLSKRKKWKDRYYKERLKNRNLTTKLNNYKTIIDEISKWLQEQYSCYSHLETISLSTNRYLLYNEVLEKLNELKEKNNA